MALIFHAINSNLYHLQFCFDLIGIIKRDAQPGMFVQPRRFSVEGDSTLPLRFPFQQKARSFLLVECFLC